MKILWKIRKFFQPEKIAKRNAITQTQIHHCEQIKKRIGEEQFNARWGKDYIEILKNDLV